MVHHVRLFDLKNEIEKLEATPIGMENKPIGVTSNTKTVTIDLDQSNYRTLILDVYGVDVLNRLLSGEYTGFNGEHPEGGKYEFRLVKDKIWNVTEYILD